MKRILIGAIVGGIIIFAWQTVSWMILDLHSKAHQYTSNQNEILGNLASQLPGEGQYFLPTLPPGSTMEQREELMKTAGGKPWAMVSYHQSMNINMTTNIIRGLLANIVLVGLFCWILSKITAPTFGTVFLASLFTGIIVFTNGIYTSHIWYETFDLMAHLTDYLVGWGLCGLFLGWRFSKK